MIPSRHRNKKIEQEIPSLLEEVDTLCLRIRKLLVDNQLAAVSFGVELLAREALNNAVIHGNKRDTDKLVHLHFSIGREWIRLQVGDEGPGFNWRGMRRRAQDISATNGRGLPLYALYAQRIQFNQCGNQITLWFGKKDQPGRKG